MVAFLCVVLLAVPFGLLWLLEKQESYLRSEEES